MAPWLMALLQQFGRDIITGAPGAYEALVNDHRRARDPYIDKRLEWFGPGGAADQDAGDHRLYDGMTPMQKQRLHSRQVSGSWGLFEATKPKWRRPWTGAFWFLYEEGQAQAIKMNPAEGSEN